MKRIVVLMTVAMFTIILMAITVAAQGKQATPAQAKELYSKIVAHTKQVGCEKAFAEFNNPASPWNATYSNVYASAGDWNGITLVNGRYPVLAGQNHMDLKDAEGKPFIKEAIEKCKKAGHAVHSYKWMVTKTNKVEDRTLMVEVVDCQGKKVDVGVSFEGKL
jgi:cytochrome c